MVRIIERVGNDLSTVVKKGFNLNELRLEKNIGDFVTYQKGFGAWTDDEDHSKGRLEVEYLSPLAEIYGRLDADPVVDERYTVKSNLENRLKSNVEGSYQISVQIDMEDLTRAGYEYKQPHEGDSIMAINKDLGFQRKVRIVSYETDFDVEGNILDHRITCNSVGMVQESIFGNASIKNSIKELQIDLELTRKQVIEWNVSADGKSTNYYGAIEPSPDDYKLSVGDTWYDSSGEETVIKVWNGVEWRKAGFDKDQFDREMAEVQAEIAETKQTADEAVNRINGEIAGKFTDIDTEISQVHNDAQNALNQAGDAVSQVAYFGETLDGFTQTVANIDGRVVNIRHDVDGITQTVTDHTGKIATVEQNLNGIQQTVSDPVNGLVTQVSTLANGFNVLVDGMQNHKNLIPYWEIGGLKAADGSDYDAEDRIRTPLIKKRTNGSAVHRFSLDGVATNASYIIRYRADGSYYDTFTSTNFVTLTDAVPYARITITGNPSTLLKRKYQLEEGEVTPYVPYVSDVNQAQLSVLNDNINLRVRKDELLSQINVQSDNILIQSGKLYLDAETVAFSGQAFIPSAAITALSADKINAGTLNAANVRVINLDFDTAVGNRTNFIRSAWETAAGGSVLIRGQGIQSTADDGSQVYIQNGVVGARDPGGSGLGHIGYHAETSRPFFHIQTSLGTNFAISARVGTSANTTRRTMMDIFPGSSETYIRTNDFRHIGATGDSSTPFARFYGDVTIDKELRMGGTNIVQPYGVYFNNTGSSIYSTTSGYFRFDTSSSGLMQFRVGGNQKFRIDSTRNYSSQILNMQGNSIVESPSVSDARMKDVYGIRTDNDLEKLMKIEYVDFRWKDPEFGGEDLGFVAQQVQNVAPELITEVAGGYLGYNQQTYLNFLGHSVQQLALREENNHKHTLFSNLISSVHTL